MVQGHSNGAAEQRCRVGLQDSSIEDGDAVLATGGGRKRRAAVQGGQTAMGRLNPGRGSTGC